MAFLFGSDCQVILWGILNVAQTQYTLLCMSLNLPCIDGKQDAHQQDEHTEQQELLMYGIHFLGEDVASCVQFTILSGLVQEVQVSIPVQVRGCLVVECAVGHTQFLVYACHPGLHYGGVTKPLFLYHRECCLEV